MAQSPSESLLNSLEYEELLTLFNDFEGDSLAQEKIARTYLERAKVDGDTVKVARGYDRLARIFHPHDNTGDARHVGSRLERVIEKTQTLLPEKSIF